VLIGLALFLAHFFLVDFVKKVEGFSQVYGFKLVAKRGKKSLLARRVETGRPKLLKWKEIYQ
jgi:hypothetical protein